MEKPQFSLLKPWVESYATCFWKPFLQDLFRFFDQHDLCDTWTSFSGELLELPEEDLEFYEKAQNAGQRMCSFLRMLSPDSCLNALEHALKQTNTSGFSNWKQLTQALDSFLMRAPLDVQKHLITEVQTFEGGAGLHLPQTLIRYEHHTLHTLESDAQVIHTEPVKRRI